jgi:hypothetical protein
VLNDLIYPPLSYTHALASLYIRFRTKLPGPMIRINQLTPALAIQTSAYNNMCYLCEKYAPIDGIAPYNPLIDPSLTGACIVPHLADGLI